MASSHSAPSCARGHAYTADNTYLRTRVRPDRKATQMRVCRRCQADAQVRSLWRRVHRLYLELLVLRGVDV